MLLQAAHKRVQSAFTPATDRAYRASFRLFLAFLAYMGTMIEKVNVEISTGIFRVFGTQ